MLPNTARIAFKFRYYDEVTPLDYEPAGFQPTALAYPYKKFDGPHSMFYNQKWPQERGNGVLQQKDKALCVVLLTVNRETSPNSSYK